MNREYETCAEVLFEWTSFAGMVGETIEIAKAYKIEQPLNQVPVLKPLSYEDLQAIYKKLTTRAERIKFYYLMRELSPEVEQERSDRAYNEAMSRVK